MSIESMMPSSHLILCHPLLILPSIFPSIRVFSSESVLHIRWPNYWSFSFRISPSNEYSGLISFRMDWLDLLAVPGTLQSLLQHHHSKAPILQCSAFFVRAFFSFVFNGNLACSQGGNKLLWGNQLVPKVPNIPSYLSRNYLGTGNPQTFPLLNPDIGT